MKGARLFSQWESTSICFGQFECKALLLRNKNRPTGNSNPTSQINSHNLQKVPWNLKMEGDACPEEIPNMEITTILVALFGSTWSLRTPWKSQRWENNLEDWGSFWNLKDLTVTTFKIFQDRHSRKNTLTWPLALIGNELILLETSHPKLEDNRVLIYISWLLTIYMRAYLCVLNTNTDTSFLVGTWNRETRSEDTRRSPAHSRLSDTVCLNFPDTKGGHRVIKLSQRNILLKTWNAKVFLEWRKIYLRRLRMASKLTVLGCA